MTKMTKKEIIHMLVDFGEWQCYMHTKIQGMGGADIWGKIPFNSQYLKFWTGETVRLDNWDLTEERDHPTYFSLTIPIAVGDWTGELRGYLKNKWYSALHFADPARAPMALYDMIYKVANGNVDLACPSSIGGGKSTLIGSGKLGKSSGICPLLKILNSQFRSGYRIKAIERAVLVGTVPASPTG